MSLASSPAIADSFEVRMGYFHNFEEDKESKSFYTYDKEGDVPPIELNLEMKLDSDITKNVLFAMRNNFVYLAENSKVSIEDGLYFKFAEHFGVLTELHIQELMIPKAGLFFLRNKDGFKSYASAKIMPGETFAGEFLIELSYIPDKKSVMVCFENRTIVDTIGHRLSKQSLKVGYKTEEFFGVGGNVDVLESGNERERISLIAGVFFGVYTK